ncbi:DUF4261 domain-containing protein [Blastopirellula marina]|nr:DUF4261 domain-containing protein [Blastopirellula marina]
MMDSIELPQNIVCVPGPWVDRNDLIRAVAKQSGGYLYAGVAMMHRETRESVTVQFEDRNPHMARAFSCAGSSWVDDEALAAIEAHRSCVYLIGEGGTEETAKNRMKEAAALLKCGGIAVKVETAGVAHSAQQWQAFSADPHLLHLFRAYVIYVGSADEGYNSCGMHNIGHPDCVLKADVDPAEAAAVIDGFLKYLLFEKPNLQRGETFGLAAGAPVYQIRHEPCETYPPGDLFHNPFGVWKLVPAE